MPVEEIALTSPELEGPDADDYEIISHKVTYRLAERPGSQVVLKYTRPVLKRKSTQRIITAPAPANVLEKSFADVSFLVGMLLSKFLYHLPLYRQEPNIMLEWVHYWPERLAARVFITVTFDMNGNAYAGIDDEMYGEFGWCHELKKDRWNADP